MRIEVVAYDPRWSTQFSLVRDQLMVALAPIAVVAIEHVGSTSVPGLAAKPIIDIDVVVTAKNVQPAIDGLAAVGYVYEGEFGVGRHGLASPHDGLRRHVYVVLDGCLALRNHLTVRAVLRADEELRDEYGALKLELAERDLPDLDAYTAAKSDLLERVMAEGGMSPAERSEIRGSIIGNAT